MGYTHTYTYTFRYCTMETPCVFLCLMPYIIAIINSSNILMFVTPVSFQHAFTISVTQQHILVCMMCNCCEAILGNT